MFATSLLKVIAFFGTWGIIWLPIAFFVARLIDWQPKQPLTVKQKLILLTSLYVLAPVIVWWKAKQEGLYFADLGLDWQPSILAYLALGLILSLVGLGIVFSLESLLGLVIWHWDNRKNLWSLAWPILGLSLAISLIEELVFRGYAIDILIIDYPYWLSAIISSIVFASLHLIWERKETIPQLPGLWLMGMILVGARLADGGSLGLACGLHAGWIWGLSCLDSAQLITYTEKNKNWITGINQQPLAGVAGILCLLVTSAALWFLYPVLVGFN